MGVSQKYPRWFRDDGLGWQKYPSESRGKAMESVWEDTSTQVCQGRSHSDDIGTKPAVDSHTYTDTQSAFECLQRPWEVKRAEPLTNAFRNFSTIFTDVFDILTLILLTILVYGSKPQKAWPTVVDSHGFRNEKDGAQHPHPFLSVPFYLTPPLTFQPSSYHSLLSWCKAAAQIQLCKLPSGDRNQRSSHKSNSDIFK